jgi:hypothetical protein
LQRVMKRLNKIIKIKNKENCINNIFNVKKNKKLWQKKNSTDRNRTLTLVR